MQGRPNTLRSDPPKIQSKLYLGYENPRRLKNNVPEQFHPQPIYRKPTSTNKNGFGLISRDNEYNYSEDYSR